MLLVGWTAAAQENKQPPPGKTGEEVKETPPSKAVEGLKEEDESLIPEQYSFNPLQADKEMRVGDFYAKKGSWKAAAGRYEEATKWNPGLAEAFLKLGQAKEKLKDRDGAREAYQKYVKLAPDTKEAHELARKLKKGKKSS